MFMNADAEFDRLRLKKAWITGLWRTAQAYALKIVLQTTFNQTYIWVVWLSVKRWNESLCVCFGSLKIWYICNKFLEVTVHKHWFSWKAVWVNYLLSAKMRFVIPTSDTRLASFYAFYLSNSLVRPYKGSSPQHLTCEGYLSFKTCETAQTHSKLKY